MQVSQALNLRRISRTLVTVLGLSLIQTVLPPVIAPQISTPKANAITNTYSPVQATEWLVPANVTQISVTIKGGSGGTGGQDCGAGCNNQAGGPRGSISYTFTVTSGDVIGIYPGSKGGNGANSTNSGGGTAGADTSLNGTFDGGAGGGAGSGGFSGAGGGGGAASVLLINSVLRAVAGGAGGGGGAANVAGSGRVGSEYSSGSLNGASFTGGAGGTTSACTTTSGGSTNDGGGSGGSGGGYYGGAAMPVYAASAGECAGNGGMRGGNYILTNEGAAVIGNSGVAQGSETVANADGSIVIDYTPASISACTETPQTVDIYRVIKLSASGSCTWTIPAGVTIIDLFAVGGGGAGGSFGGSGGGGGAAISRTALPVTASTNLTVKLGYGGGASFTDGWSGGNGDSTTISFPSGLFLAANGGSMGVKGDGTNAKVGGLGGTAVNGGFAGGAGGVSSTTLNSRGAVGKTGISNYFAGSVAEFGGGGGGGMHKNACSPLDGQLGSSGGAAGASCNSNVNSAGGSALAETGGGGGGGGYGTSGNTLGGKGGSGVVYVRYAINAADAFPASLSSALAGRYSPGDLQLLDSTRKGWIDSTGTNASVSNANITSTGLSILSQGVTDGGVTTGSSKSLLAVRGTSSSQITLQNLNVGYTLFHVARYVDSGTNARMFSARDANWLSGFYYGVRETHHGAWLTDGAGVVNTQWLLSTDQAVAYRANGIDVADNDDSIGTQQTSAANFGINNWVSGERGDFQVSDVIIFNRELSVGEIRLMEVYLSRLNGLTLSPYFNTSETDTTNTITASYSYFFMQQDIRNNLNDTFTVEAWLRPDATCNTTVCTYFARENSVRLVVRNGLYEFILYGDGGWAWVPTGVPVKSGEWQHVAISKTLRGNRGDSVKLYINGQLAFTKAGSPYRLATTASTNSDASTLNQVTTWSYIGLISGGTERWRGDIDEFKIWKVARTQSEIQASMHSNDASSPLMQAYFDMNFVPGARNNEFKIPNLAYGGHARSDLFNWSGDTLSFTDVKNVSTSGPYTTITFPRTYITQNGGWKSPDSITAASVLVVGGGGGGGYNSGSGGGGGGVLSVNSTSLTGIKAVKVGVGGLGAVASSGITPVTTAQNGQVTDIGDLSAVGGNAGSVYPASGGVAVSTTTGTSGAGGAGSPNSSTTASNGGTGLTSTFSGTSLIYGSGGGGGGWSDTANGGLGGSGAGAGGTTSSIAGSDATANRGGGGGGSSRYANGGNGGSGLVIVRYITALRPTYTKPVNAYLNVGMNETFTTNVAQDSATAMLTRTFRWESSTAGAAGPFTTIKQGTGAANAAFSWIPTDTSTTGSQYLYRLTVTDSDTAGLFITDSSTAFAVINRTLQMTGVTSIKKAINVSRNDTFTVVDGTPGYRYTLSPVIPGITLDTSTVGSPVIRISDTATIGTFLETLTVTDSVSASVQIPLTINISAPPSLTNTSEVIATGQVFSIDPSNSASYNRTTGAFSDISGAKHPISLPNGATFSTDSSGIVSLASSSSQYMSATGFTQLSKWTIETWIRLDGEVANYFCPLTSEFAPTNMSYLLCLDSTRTVYTGFHNGSWTYKRSTNVIPLNTWTHLVGTFDGTTINLYIDGVAITVKDSSTAAGTTPPQPSTDRIFLGKHYATAVGTTVSVSYGLARLYSTGFTQSDVLTNYNATKERFTSANLNQLKPSQKYGILNVESFTVTSGGDTKTVTFAVGNRTGITWDTSTVAGRINLSVQESLTPGTYYDTITVTDNLGQSTSLPITFTVSKADTITVIAGAATTQVFNNLPATSIPNFTISGLVSSDAGTVQRKYTGVDWTKPCSQGGGCEVGDTGSGGGTIFYISPTVINTATGISSGGTYLEVAPINWSGLNVESKTVWAKATTTIAGTLSAIGRGAENTRLINTALTINSVAAKVAADLVLNTKSDWFLPSTLELKEMYDALYTPGLAGGFGVDNYWSSTQDPTSGQTARADTYYFGAGGLVSPTAKTNTFVVRPIRAYSPDTITVTTVPTGADSYTVTVDTVTMTTGSISYYQNVIFQRSGLEITKARQSPLNINLYGATFGLPFTITLLGGSGTGAVTESLTAGSTATGCAIAAHVLTSTTAGACNLQVKKAASRNYLVETATAIVYFLNWVINQPTNQVGGGATIGLNGETVVTRDPNAAPAITSLSTYTGQAGVTQIQINGTGFNHLDTGNIIVKFWRNVIASGFTVNAGDSVITVTIPAGAITGKVTVTTPNGLAVSEFPITITP